MTTRSLLSAACLLFTACGSSIAVRFPAQLLVPEPAPSDVDAVLFLVGDAGATAADRSPVLAHLTADVERWSRELGHDSAVAVAFLGDIVYPSGVHDRGDGGFPRDSVRLWNQINVVRGPQALAHKALGLFLAGNHDWGNRKGEAGLARVRNLSDALDRARSDTVAHVELLPSVGHPGPAVRDVRDNIRLLFLDTNWWLNEGSNEEKAAFLGRVEAAIRGAGGREIIILGHHPWASAGPHGAIAFGSRALGVLYLLAKSGAFAQDLNSLAFQDFRARLRQVFVRTGTIPLIFAAGHDHSLQVISGREAGDPRHILISGAGSKLTSVGDTTALRHAAVRPGYMSLIFRRDGSVDLFVHAGPAAYLRCPGNIAARERCMRVAADSFATIYSDRLLPAR